MMYGITTAGPCHGLQTGLGIYSNLIVLSLPGKSGGLFQRYLWALELNRRNEISGITVWMVTYTSRFEMPAQKSLNYCAIDWKVLVSPSFFSGTSGTPAPSYTKRTLLNTCTDGLE